MSLVYFRGSNNGSTPSFAQAIYDAGFFPESSLKNRKKGARHAPYPPPYNINNDPLMMSMDERLPDFNQTVTFLPAIPEEPSSCGMQTTDISEPSIYEQLRLNKGLSTIIDLALAVVHKLKGGGMQQQYIY